jgi:hypothetical protein
MSATLTREMYCQYLLSSQTKYNQSHLASHVAGLNHDDVYRYLKYDKLTPSLVWERVKPIMTQSGNAYIIFDDTVLDKSYSFAIDGVRRQWSGNAKTVIKGIGVVNCLYYEPAFNKWWIIDYRIFDPERDGKTKHDHVRDMLESAKYRGLLFSTVLMDAWYATAEMMRYLIDEGKRFFCPLKSNRKVDDSEGKEPYKYVRDVQWTADEEQHGKMVKLHKFPKDMRLKLFRVVVSSDRTDYIVTNDVALSSTTDVQDENAIRWHIEQFHREEKQLTGIEQSPCRLNRSQRNHICSAILVWVRLKEAAYATQKTVYALKEGLLHDYLVKEMLTPKIAFT